MWGIPSDRMPPHVESIPLSAHKVFCEYMCGIPSDRMPPRVESIHISAHKINCGYMWGIPSDRMPPHLESIHVSWNACSDGVDSVCLLSTEGCWPVQVNMTGIWLGIDYVLPKIEKQASRCTFTYGCVPKYPVP